MENIPTPHPYPAYKPSDVPWLGDVPQHWEVRPGRSVFTEINERDKAAEQMLSVTIGQGVIRQQSLLQDSAQKDSSRLDKSAYKFVRPGDIVYNKMRAWQGAAGMSRFRGIVSPAYIVQRPRTGANPDYFHRLLRIPAFATEAERWSYGIASDMWSLRPEHFKMIHFPLPPLPEQRAIVRYLDHVDERIQRYVDAKEKLVGVLEEEKQAVVNRAVTRGLDPNVRLKPSGVDWLGDVPEHWEMRRLKTVGEAVIGLTYRPQDLTDEGAGILVLRASNILNGGLVYRDNVYVSSVIPPKLITREGDILICSRSGSRALIGKNALIGSQSAGTTFGAFMTVFRSHNNDYLHQLFNSRLFEYQSAAFFTSTINQLTLGILYNMKIPFPPIEERQSIMQYLEEASGPINAAITRARRQIELLQEYRTRLITDVVTGKVDVREAASQLPEHTMTESG